MLTLAGVLAALGAVLVAIGATAALARRFLAAPRTRGALRMEVVQRLALGPKQGIAVVRVGERIAAVSLGEGGIRHLFDLDPAVLENPARQDGAAPPAVPFAQALQARLRAALRTAAALAPLVLPLAALLALPAAAFAQAETADALTRLAPQMDLQIGAGDGGLRLSGTVGIIVMMGLLTLLPTLVLLMTSFTRIFVVLSLLKQALGTQSAPPAHLVAGLALLLTGFVMAPTLADANRVALQPWMEGSIEQAEMLSLGVQPFREFMLAQTRDRDVEAFLEMSRAEVAPASEDEIPLTVLMSAFVTSELKTAFQIGFALFLPFIIIDIVVASVLMSMGMFMLPPVMVSLPFKLLLFVLVDGWTLVVQSLVASFR